MDGVMFLTAFRSDLSRISWFDVVMWSDRQEEPILSIIALFKAADISRGCHTRKFLTVSAFVPDVITTLSSMNGQSGPMSETQQPTEEIFLDINIKTLKQWIQ